MLDKLKVAIIGAGNIGAFLDNPGSKDILSHAHAYKKHPGFELAGFVDVDFKKAEDAARIWGGVPAISLSDLCKKTKVDVVSLCVPDGKHFKILKEIERLNVIGGIIEKPLTISIENSKKIVDSLFFKRHKFLINYTRRFVPEFQILKKSIAEGKYGKFLNGCGTYGKGLLHSGSHLVDLARYLLGEMRSEKISSPIYDFSKEDPTYPLLLKLDNGGTVLVNIIDSRYFTVFELDLYFANARIRIVDGGFQIEEYVIKENTMFKGYKTACLAKITKTSMNKAIYYAVDNLYKVIVSGGKPICTVEDGFKTQKICTFRNKI